jgi:hypothetical protein
MRPWRFSISAPPRAMAPRRSLWQTSSNDPSSTRLWLLRPRADVLARESHPWAPWFEKVFGVVARASDEIEARALAQSEAGHEGVGIYRELGCAEEQITAAVWLDASYTACEELQVEGPPAVILVDRREA